MSLPALPSPLRLLAGGALLICACGLAGSLSASEDPQAAEYRVPLSIPQCGTVSRELPALIITSLDAGAWKQAAYALSDRGIEASWGGLWPEDCRCDALFRAAPPLDPRLPMATDTVPTYALVSGSGELRPRELVRAGNHFTVRCDGIEAQQMERGSPQRQVYAVSLGVLPAGAYECSLQITWRTRPAVGCADLRLARYAGGTMPFRVLSHLGADDVLPARVLTDQDIAVPSSAVFLPPPWQEPRCRAYALAGDGLVGLWDTTEINLAMMGPAPVTPPPHGVAQHLGTYSAVILGPTLNTGEEVHVAAVTVDHGVHQVLLETWTDDFDRSANVRHRELLVVPIEVAPGAPAHPPVVLVWRDLHASAVGVYRERIQMAHCGPIRASKFHISVDPIPGPVDQHPAANPNPPTAIGSPISAGPPEQPVAPQAPAATPGSPIHRDF